MIVQPTDGGIRARKPNEGKFRKQNYWSTQTNPEVVPWYVWDKYPKKGGRSRSEERPSQCFDVFLEDIQPRKEVREYLLTSTLHGLRYIGDGKLTWFERFFWLTAFCCSLVCATFFILNIYDKWQSSPMIVSINPRNLVLQNLPFPAVTVCNVNQAKKSVALRYKESGSNLDKKLLQSLCSSENDSVIFDNFTGNADWDYFRSFLINVTQPCAEMLAECVWNSAREDCLSLFNAQLTDEGLCCTFNVVHRNMMFRNPRDLSDLNITFPAPAVDWTPEGGYPPDSPHNGFPWKPQGVGTHHGLTLVLDANIAEYYCASTAHTGFKILLHNPTETPKIAKLGDIYGPGLEARVEVTPRILDANPQIMGIDLDKRLCVFSSERVLIFYRTYTQRNCEMECEASTMLERCQCVLYYMPKNRSTRVCGKADADCYSYKESPPMSEKEMRLRTCDCLPSCTELSYQVRRSDAHLSEQLVRQNPLYHDYNATYFRKNMLVVHFFFEDSSFIRYTKGEIFGLTEFLSNTGGLLGLCMGFSMMSFVELVYFVTLRAACAPRRRPKLAFTR